MFEQELTPAEQKVLDIFLKSKNSGEVKNRIARYVQSALNEGNALQPRMLGEALTKEQILDLEALHQEQIELDQTMKELDAVSEEYTADTININGKERPVYNSEGKRIAKSEKAIRAFYKWFGDSKVVDSKGRPRVMYHGTNASFDTFDIEKFGKTDSGHYGKGFYFEMRRAFAKSYGKKVMKVYLKANNIFNADNVNLLEYLKETNFITQKKYKQLLKDSRLILDMPIKDRVFASKDVKDKEKRALAEYRVLFSEALKEQGYDGIQHYTEFVVFSPTQIKSVDNRGTFDPENPNIYYQEGVDKIDSSELYYISNGNKISLVERENAPKIASDDTMVKVVELDGYPVPEFKKVSDLVEWIKENLSIFGDIKIKSTGQTIYVGNTGLQRAVKKRGKEHKQVFAKLKELVYNAQYVGFEENDGLSKHKNIDGQDVYFSALVLNGKPYSVRLKVDVYDKGKITNYSDHSVAEIEIAPENNVNEVYKPLQSSKGAITEVSIAVLRGKVNPARYDSENNRLYQRAFSASRVDYDRPSLEAIGSGEGNQAHGWGLYYALKRDVAEIYRTQFLGYEALKEMSSFFEDGKFLTISAAEMEMILTGSPHPASVYESEIKRLKSADQSMLSKRQQEAIARAIDYDERMIKAIKHVQGKTRGQVHEVEIPENPYLLDEDARFFGQPDIVQKALISILNELSDKQISKEFEGTEYPENRDALSRMWKVEDYDFNNTGRGIYKSLSKMLGSDKAASQMLEKYGVKGITYEGRRDGRCFVIFNPDDVQVIDKFYQKDYGSMRGNLIPVIDTSAFGEDMFEGLEEIDGKKFIPVYNLGKLREFAEKIADKIVEASDFAKSYVSQSKKSEATYINLYAKDEDFSPRIKIRLATHKPIHYESISTFYYDLNKTLKENMVELNNLIKGKEFGQVSTGREQQAMIDALYGTDRGVWGNAFSFEGLEDHWFGQSAKAREERRSFVKGAFDPLIKAIEITEHADYSTLSHEFSHYWIDSIWGHIESGNASKEY